VPSLPPSRLPELDYLDTSARPTFAALPDAVRAALGGAAGSPVARAAAPVTSGFSGAYAGRLLLEDGREVFAKAGGAGLPHVREALGQEAAILPELTGLRCPTRLVGAGEVLADAVPWRLLVLEVVNGRQPGGPWTETEADATVRACVEIAGTPPDVVARVTSTPLASEIGSDGGAHATLDALAAGGRTWPSGMTRPTGHGTAELVALAGRAERACRGEALVHWDVRPDNLLVEEDGTVRVCDWNWVRVGPPWADLVSLWPRMARQGIDVRAHRSAPVLRGARDDDIDAFLAAVAGFVLENVDEPPPPGCTASLRRHQLLLAEATIRLIAERRGWSMLGG
jgi:Phosphotransferase enzyme family